MTLLVQHVSQNAENDYFKKYIFICVFIFISVSLLASITCVVQNNSWLKKTSMRHVLYIYAH